VTELKNCHTIAPFAMRRVVLESPFAGDIPANITYARACIRDALMRGETPVASHLLYTQEGILDDSDPVQRAHGINAGHAWIHGAHAMVVYTDRGISSGMQAGINSAEMNGLPIEYRSLEKGALR
jgi:hypothetical protein